MFNDLIQGKKFNRLFVIGDSGERNACGLKLYKCVCDCGNETTATKYALLHSKKKSCGCLLRETSLKALAHIKQPHYKNLVGMKFGRLLVLKRVPAPEGKKKAAFFECLCDCGNKKIIQGFLLSNGTTRSCGCLAKEVRTQTGKNSQGRVSKKRIDITGKRFGRLTVLEPVKRSNYAGILWRCVCDCGNETITTGSKLRSGHTQSCGCLGLQHATEAKIKHGKTGTAIYAVWSAMRQRCSNSKNKAFRWYGGKGVKVCEDWLNFKNFYDWAISHGYAPNLTIDRLDANGNYEPSNCEWVTKSENSRRMNIAHWHKQKS